MPAGRTNRGSLGVLAANLVAVLWAGSACTDGTLQVWSQRQAPTQAAGDSGTAVASAGPPASSSAVIVDGSSGDAASGSSTAEPLTLPLLVDDFEDGDTRAASGLGWWYTQSDTTGQQTLRIEAPNDPARGAFSAHHSGFGFSVWGALFGLDFTQGEGPLDASRFSVLRFQARVGEGSVTQVSARLLDPDGQYAVELALSTEWREYRLPFRSLVAVDGSGTLLDPVRLTQLHIFIFSSDYFDLWLDDLILE